MKCVFLTSFVIFGLCVMPGLSAPVIVTSGAGLNAQDPVVVGDTVIIGAGGEYSFSRLNTVSVVATGVVINKEYTSINTYDPVILIVDNSFSYGGTFVSPLVIESDDTRIRFDASFFNDGAAEQSNLIRFNSIEYDNETNVVENISSSDYFYYISNCTNGSGKCIHRRYSDAYMAAHNTSAGLTGINSIIQYTPSVLLRPVAVVNQHELFGAYDFADDYFISVVPEYYNARDFNDMGLRLNMGTKFGGHLFAGVSAYLSTANFKYGVDDFDYAVYGGNLRVLYELNDTMFVRGVGGLSLATVKSAAENNPNIFSSYFGADVGAKFNFESGLYVSPFVGYGMTNAAVLGVHDNTYLLHTGTDVGFKYFMDGVSYSYNLRAGVNTDGCVDASVGINAWTVSDKIGGGVAVGVVDTEFGWSGKFSANVRFAF